jgi:small multidrug resistance pump
MQGWLYLVLAILLEVAGTTSMKLSGGFSKLIPSVSIFVFYGLSFVSLTLALKKVEISVAYAIWAGVGTALITLIGIIYFSESMTLIKLLGIGLIIVGVVGVNLGDIRH